MTPKKFSLIPGNISRFFILMVIVLLATMGVMIQSAVNAWLKEKSYQVVDVSHALHQRIDAWRYATWQIYDNIAATSVNTASGGLHLLNLVGRTQKHCSHVVLLQIHHRSHDTVFKL